MCCLRRKPSLPSGHPCLLQGTRCCQWLGGTNRLFLGREKLNSLKFDSLLWLSSLLEFLGSFLGYRVLGSVLGTIFRDGCDSISKHLLWFEGEAELIGVYFEGWKAWRHIHLPKVRGNRREFIRIWSSLGENALDFLSLPHPPSKTLLKGSWDTGDTFNERTRICFIAGPGSVFFLLVCFVLFVYCFCGRHESLSCGPPEPAVERRERPRDVIST